MKLRHVVPVLLVAAVVPSLAAAGTSSRQSITLIGIAAGSTNVDADHSGKPSIGDYSVDRLTMVDPSNGKKVGFDVVTCTILDRSATQYYCQGFDKFAGRGELMIAGFFSGLSYRAAIVGGTGQFAGARGWETGTFNAKLTKVHFTDTFSLLIDWK